MEHTILSERHPRTRDDSPRHIRGRDVSVLGATNASPKRSRVSSSVRAFGTHPYTWLVVLLLFLAGYRFTLIDSGHFYWGDERRYLVAEQAVEEFLAGHVRSALGLPYTCGGRPGLVYVSVLPILMQRAAHGLTGVEPETLGWYDAASAFNVLVSLAITVCVWGLARAWLGRPWYALLVTTVVSLSCFANVWIRHMMPYNNSLLMFLGAAWLLSGATRVDRRGVAAGCLTVMGFACYPGYFMFVLVNVVIALATTSRRLRTLLMFGGGAAMVLAALEGAAQVAGTSYMREVIFCMSAHGDFVQGWPAEGYVFLWRYLRDVEGAAGMLLFALFLAYVGLVHRRRGDGLSSAGRAGVTAAIACYLLHASVCVFTERAVIYGRTLGMYLPFIAVGAVAALGSIDRRKLRQVAVCTLLLVSAWSFGSFAVRYARISYPADFLVDTMATRSDATAYPPTALWGYVGGEPDSVEELNLQFVNVSDARAEGTESPLLVLESHESAGAGGARFIGVNLKWVFYFRGQDDRFTLPEGYELVAERLSPLTFPATGFEAYKPWERKRLMQRQYTMRIYERARDLSVSLLPHKAALH